LLSLVDKGGVRFRTALVLTPCRRKRQGLGIIFASGAVAVPKVEGHELIADAVVLGKPYDETALKTAIKQVQDGTFP
jgi:hypothetical protein